MRRIYLPKPPTRRKVYEFAVGPRWRWLLRHEARTFVLPFAAVIFYTFDTESDVYRRRIDPGLRVHEFTHVKQAERMPFLLYALRTLWELRLPYHARPLEIEAYEAQAAPLPLWARLGGSKEK